MITPDAKCVVNGSKVNEAIIALNPLLSMSVGYIGGGKPPQVTYSDGEVKILLPLADSVEGFSMEELDVVDSNNAASSRYFMTSLSSVSTYGTTTASTSGTPTGRQSSPQPTKGRNKLNAGGNSAGNNRDQLSTGGRPIAPGNAGVAPTGNISSGRPIAPAGDLVDDGMTAKQAGANFLKNKQRAGSANMISLGGAGVDEFGNTIGGSGRGDLADDGSTAADSRAKFLAARQGATTTPTPLPGAPPLGGDTTPPPLPGAPPLGGDTTPPPLPGAPPLGGDTTPKTKRGQPSRATGTPFASQEIINAGQWVPQKNGMADIQELGKIVAAGTATPYQQDFYNNATANSLPTTDGKINLQAISNNIKEGTATPYQQDFYNKAMGIDGTDTPTGAGTPAASGKGASEDYYVSGLKTKAHVTDMEKDKAVMKRDRRKEKGPTRRRKQFSPIIEAQAAVKRLEDQLFKAKKDDKLKYDWSTNMWVYKKAGDPDSDLVKSLKSQIKSAKARVKRIKKE